MSSNRELEVTRFVRAALECSIHHAPRDPGLTREELSEVAKRLGYGKGETFDALRSAAEERSIYADRLLPQPTLLCDFNFARELDYRNRGAFQFVYDAFAKVDAAERRGKGRISRDVLVERGAEAGFQRADMEVAVAMLVMAKAFIAESGVLRRGPSNYAEPKLQGNNQRTITAGVNWPSIRAAVGDIVERRADGRPLAADPWSAFAERLNLLGYGKFRQWWVQTVSELKLLEPQQTPTSVIVLSAAVVEGALTFVVQHARGQQLGPMGSTKFSADPRTWRFEDLVNSAAHGGPSAILDEATKSRALTLNAARQRIHAGRMIQDYPEGVPDLKPEEARDAAQTAEVVVRKVLDWCSLHAPSA